MSYLDIIIKYNTETCGYIDTGYTAVWPSIIKNNST